MRSLIDKFKPTPGRRDALLAILPESVGDMPGCLGSETVPVGARRLAVQVAAGV